MNVDLLASTSYISVNKRLAELFGLSEAVYLSELFNICKKVINKKSFDATTGEFKLDRKYIAKQTTIKPDKQCEYDQKFQECGILTVNQDNVDIIKLATSKVISIITCEDVKVLKAVVSNSKQSAEEKREAKHKAIIQMLKNNIKETNEAVKAAMESWVEVAYDKGMNKKAQVTVFEDQLNSYSQDPEVKLAIVQICISRAYKTCDWGIEIYEKTKPAITNSAQKVSEGLDYSKGF